MADIKDLYLGELTPSEVFKELKVRGVPEKEAAVVVGSWILDYFGRGPRRFRYEQPLAANEPECTSQFSRRFHHADWIDGESVVQAELTPGEDGFNQRFHWIEQDIDGLAAEVAKAFACLAELRGQLSTLLEEIKLELNRLNEALGTGGTVVPPIKDPGFFNPHILDFAKFAGTTKFFGKDVTVWNTTGGTFVLPAVQGIGAVDPSTGPRIRRAGDLARYIEETPRIREVFTGAVNRERVMSEFGDDLTASGRPLRELLEVLPMNAEFASLDAMVDAVAERDAAAIRTEGEADPLLIAHFGLNEEATTVAEAPVARLETVPERARRALVAGGVETIGNLAERNPTELADLMRASGVEMSRGEAAEMIGRARTLRRIR
jgi:hypothetical protein